MEDTHVSSCWHGTLSADIFSAPNVLAGHYSKLLFIFIYHICSQIRSCII